MRSFVSFLIASLLSFGHPALGADPVTGETLLRRVDDYVGDVVKLSKSRTAKQVELLNSGWEQGVKLPLPKGPIREGQPRGYDPTALQAIGMMTTAVVAPWAMFGIFLLPIATPLFLIVPAVTTALALCSPGRPPCNSPPYVELMKDAETARRRYPEVPANPALTPPAFRALVAAIQKRMDELSQDFDDEVRTRHELTLRPDVESRERLLTSYLELWTLAALYRIESVRYQAAPWGRHEAARDGGVSAVRLEDQSLAVDECRIAILRMSDPKYRWPE